MIRLSPYHSSNLANWTAHRLISCIINTTYDMHTHYNISSIYLPFYHFCTLLPFTHSIMMDIINFSTFLFAFSFLISLLVLGITRFKTSHSTCTKLPPGPWKLPILGNLHQLAGCLPHRKMRDLARKYGPLMHLQLGQVSHIVVSSPEIAKEVMKTQDTVFASRPNIILSEILLYNDTGITFAPYGDYWRQLKKMCASELLSAKRVKSFRGIREQETLNMIKWVASKQGKSINLTEIVFSLVFSITSRATFGKKTVEQEKLINVIKQASVLAAGVDISDLYPSFKFLRWISKVNITLKRIFLESDPLLEKIVNDHKTATKYDEVEEDSRDLVDVLLKYQEQNPDFLLTKENIKAVLMDISIGGTDGSANTINWAMAEMIKNPSILKRAQQEVRKAFENHSHIYEENFDELHYVKSVIKETLRLHPPAPLLVPRENNETAQINGYQIPAKSKVLINVWAINRDPRYWEEAESFKPERFLESSVDYKGTDFQYLTFGAGRRMCPGIAYGWANVVLPLVQLLYYFDWKLPIGMKHEELDMEEEHGLAVRRKDDLYLIPFVCKAL